MIRKHEKERKINGNKHRTLSAQFVSERHRDNKPIEKENQKDRSEREREREKEGKREKERKKERNGKRE